MRIQMDGVHLLCWRNAQWDSTQRLEAVQTHRPPGFQTVSTTPTTIGKTNL